MVWHKHFVSNAQWSYLILQDHSAEFFARQIFIFTLFLRRIYHFLIDANIFYVILKLVLHLVLILSVLIIYTKSLYGEIVSSTLNQTHDMED